MRSSERVIKMAKVKGKRVRDTTRTPGQTARVQKRNYGKKEK
jgi:hypothetical protein